MPNFFLSNKNEVKKLPKKIGINGALFVDAAIEEVPAEEVPAEELIRRSDGLRQRIIYAAPAAPAQPPIDP